MRFWWIMYKLEKCQNNLRDLRLTRWIVINHGHNMDSDLIDYLESNQLP